MAKCDVVQNIKKSSEKFGPKRKDGFKRVWLTAKRWIQKSLAQNEKMSSKEFG